MRQFIILSSIGILIGSGSHSQGCIMVRNIAGFGQYNFTDRSFSSSDWQFNITTRYFKAWRDFKGTVDQKTIADSQSIIRSFTMDMTMTRLMKNGWSISGSIPILVNSRSSVKDHDSIHRHTTHTFGLGDIRVTVYKWFLKPAVSQKMNIQLGLGIKFPTGDYKYEDYHYRKDGSRVLAPVNASISLGDGGTGIITELNTFYIINKNINLYGNFFYLFNPRDVSGVSSTNGDPPKTLQLQTGGNIYSVPDIYAARIGMNYELKRFSFSGGLRLEGVPVYDILGGSEGVRRPGHNLSVEPGILLKLKNMSFYAYVPVIIQRSIEMDVPSRKATEIDGGNHMKSGASGDYFVFLGALFKL